MSAPAASTRPGADQPGMAQPGMARVGQTAPDFVLPSQFGTPTALSALRGQAVALVFYPFAFSNVCTGELTDLRDQAALFTDAGVRLLAVSVDSKFTLRAYAQAHDFPFELLSDFWPHGRTAQDYGVFDAVHGRAERATFLIDAAGVIRDAFASPPGEARPLARYRAALARLTP